MGEITRHSDYGRALITMNQRIQTSQSHAVMAVNTEALNQPTVGGIESELVQGNGGLPSND